MCVCIFLLHFRLDYCSCLGNLEEIKTHPNYKFVKGNICSPELVSYPHIHTYTHIHIQIYKYTKQTYTHIHVHVYIHT